jgi:hypothetical protein
LAGLRRRVLAEAFIAAYSPSGVAHVRGGDSGSGEFRALERGAKPPRQALGPVGDASSGSDLDHARRLLDFTAGEGSVEGPL